MAVECVITVDYDELPGSPREDVTYTNIKITRHLQCDYDDRITLACELCGYVMGGTYHLPHEYKPVRSTSWSFGRVYCQSVLIEPLKSTESGVGYRKARLVAEYEFAEGEYEETTYVTETLEPAAEFLTLDRTLYWEKGAADADKVEASQAPGLLVPMCEWSYTIHRLPVITVAMMQLPGHINDATVYSKSLGYTFGVETLLCGNPTMTRQITSLGDTAWTATFRFLYRINGWNKVPRENDVNGAIRWVPLYDKNDNDIIIHPLADFGAVII